jgi:DNA (cytosine-5)-methyltransferase 1
VFALRMPAHHTTVSESSLLRSPKASEGSGGALGEAEALRRGNTVGVRDQVMDLVAGQGLKVSRQADNLLPTVTTSEANGAGVHGDGGQDLRTTVSHLLPTPTVVDMGGNKTPDEWEAWTDEQRAKHSNGNGHGASLNIEAVKLMPTPNTMDMLPRRSDEALARARSKGGSSNLKDAEIVRNPKLLPTTRASDGYERRNQKTMDRIAEEGGDMTMPTLARTQTDWGKFAPAIERWEEVLGQPAPSPTKPDGKDGAHRLSSEFTEWMMGLPAGWITGVGLSRNEELKACGNGVVPQQAELALRMLLEGLPVERERERENCNVADTDS